MEDITKIDRNFEIKTELNLDNVRFYDARDPQFSLYGVFYENGRYRRMPQKVAETVNPGVVDLHKHTAGGRLKFTTNSEYVAIHAVLPGINVSPHFSLSGKAGFDLYVGRKETYYATFLPSVENNELFERVVHFGSRRNREITIHFPLYNGVASLLIGLEQDARVEKFPGYRQEKPIVFYGSSITQGGCASRPGNAYTTVAARSVGANHINLGFSGNARAEDEIAQYIAGLDMSVFVYDYDHNAPTLEHLQNTHQKMFRTIRQKHPTLPIVILSRPKYKPTAADLERMEVIRKTYTDALAEGDQNVYFIEGRKLMKYAKNEGTVDGCHPNDLGFSSMARVLTPLLKKLV